MDGTITKYLYDGDKLLAEYDATDTLQKNYFYGFGDINPSILYEGSSVYFFNHDHLNTPQAITDESGTIAWEATYKSFGETNITTETVSNNFRFPGQYYDQESGLHYNYFRYYDSTTGRYLREDPIHQLQYQGSNIPYLPTFILRNPHGFNPYIYVSNNPIKSTDLLGLFGDDIGPWWPPWDPPIKRNPNQCMECDWEKLAECINERVSRMTLYNCIKCLASRGTDSDACGKCGLGSLGVPWCYSMYCHTVPCCE